MDNLMLMSIQDFLFYILAGVVLGSAAMVVFMRNAISSALFMIVSLVSIGGLCFLLDAYFIGVLQVLVYAGAVMVLFVFIIMMLGAQDNLVKIPRSKWLFFIGILTFIFFLGASIYTIQYQGDLPAIDLARVEVGPQPDAGDYNDFSTSVKSFGYSLFTKYLLPFQLAGFMLLMAMLGVIVLTKRLKHRERGEDL